MVDLRMTCEMHYVCVRRMGLNAITGGALTMEAVDRAACMRQSFSDLSYFAFCPTQITCRVADE